MGIWDKSNYKLKLLVRKVNSHVLYYQINYIKIKSSLLKTKKNLIEFQ